MNDIYLTLWRNCACFIRWYSSHWNFFEHFCVWVYNEKTQQHSHNIKHNRLSLYLLLGALNPTWFEYNESTTQLNRLQIHWTFNETTCSDTLWHRFCVTHRTQMKLFASHRFYIKPISINIFIQYLDGSYTLNSSFGKNFASN